MERCWPGIAIQGKLSFFLREGLSALKFLEGVVAEEYGAPQGSRGVLCLFERAMLGCVRSRFVTWSGIGDGESVARLFYV